MKIKKVDDKPMVIHTKQKAKIHTHEPKQASIKGSNIVVLQIKLCSILQIIWNRFWCYFVNIIRLFGTDSALCSI